MKKIIRRIVAILILLIVSGGLYATGTITKEVKTTTFYDGIFIEDIAMGGKSKEEATNELAAYVDDILSRSITLKLDEETKIITSMENLGVACTNLTEIVDEAYGFGRDGNILENYNAKEALLNAPQEYTLSFSVDENATEEFVQEHFEQYNTEPVDGTYSRKDGELNITPDVKGRTFNTNQTVEDFLAYAEVNLFNEEHELYVTYDITEAELTEEELLQMNDILGTFTTGYSTSGWSRSRNLENGITKIDGWILNPGESFSLYEATEPFTYENGYYDAGAYLGGIVVESIGGGMCQVTTTLYNAALLAELEITQRNPHSMTVSYVPLSMDAALSGTTKDLKFVNSLDHPIYIEGVYENQEITVTIYGKDERPDNREVKYESIVLEKITPTADRVVQTEEYPFGYVKTQGVHYGYETELWKVVYVDGEEVERVFINESTYSAVPRTLVVGVAGASEDIRAAVGAAAATGSIDVTRGAVSDILATPAE